MTNWLEQKVYEFGTSDGSKYRFKGKPTILIVVNGNKTDVPLQQLFLNNKVTFFEDECDIKGYSILQVFKATPNGLIYDDLSLKFFDSKNEQELFIFRIRNPFMQWNDELIPKDYFDKMIEVLKSYQIAKVGSEPEPKVVEETILEPQVENIKEEPVIELYKSPKYDNEKESLIKDGYEEFSSDNYRVLTKEGNEPIVVLITKDEDFEVIKNHEIKDNIISFKNGEESISIKLESKSPVEEQR